MPQYSFTGNNKNKHVFKFRQQRGSYVKSMETIVELNNRAELIAHLQKIYPEFQIEDHEIEIHYYGHDPRNNWQTYLITYHKQALGFTDGEL